MGYLYNFILQVFCIVWVLTKINNKHELYKQSYNSVGRSLYVCKNLECVKSLIKKKWLRGALKFNNQEEIERIESELLKMFN